MKKLLASLIVLAIFATLLTTVAFAHTGEPIGGCPDGFHIVDITHHDHGEHMHKHVGNAKDQNGDDYLCVKHVGVDGDIHLHIDNNVPLR